MSKQTVFDLVTFIDSEVESLIHALNIAADKNDADADSLGHSYEESGIVRALRESAASRRRTAAKLGALYEDLSDSDLEWLDNAARGWVRA